MCPEDTGTDGYAYITITPVRAGLGRFFFSELLGGRRVDDDTITAAMHTFSFLLFSFWFIYFTFSSLLILCPSFFIPSSARIYLSSKIDFEAEERRSLHLHIMTISFFPSLFAPIYTRERRVSFPLFWDWHTNYGMRV